MTTTAPSTPWRTVTTNTPCPICTRTDWCAISHDQSATICRRVDAGGEHRVDRSGVDYWLHRTNNNSTANGNGTSHHHDTTTIPYDPGTPQVGLADPDTLHHAYTTLLDQLTLTDTHRNILTERGITGTAITTGQYKTLPPKNRADLAAKVAAKVGTETLTGVPGFHHHHTTGDLIVGGKAGLLVPVRDPNHRIIALKARADTTNDDGTPRYTFVSSAHRGGASPGAPLHTPIHAPPHNPDTPLTIRVTEGELKADAATLGDHTLTISIPGVGAWRKALTHIADLQATRVRLAFDADWADNPRVAGALAGAARAMLAAGHETWIETWPLNAAKGIDDLMVQGLRPRAVAADTWLASRGETITNPTPDTTTDDPTGGTITLPAGEYACTDDGNALRLIAAFGEDIRWDTAAGKWLSWDGTRWATDNTFEVVRRARAVSRSITKEAEQVRDPDLAKTVRRWANTSQSKGRLDAMVALAKTDPGVAFPAGALDADTHVLNVANGTVDLRTGELHDHDRSDLISKVAPVVYDPTATHDTWDRFLSDLTDGDTELEQFLQRLVGYSLLGDPGEEVLPVLYGSGGTGKSTFVDAVRAATGDYGQTADFETFLDKKFGGGVRNDIAALAGARIVTSIEVDDGKKLAAALVKSITGGDTIRARYLYREAFEFRPQFCLWLICNHAPDVPHDDSGLWRRILRIPMNRVVPHDSRDPRIKATLRDPSVGGPAVLAWAVRGCQEYLQHGLKVPDAIHKETETYRAEQDPLHDLWGDWLTLDPNAFTANADIHTAYKAWADETGEPRPMSARGLGAVIAGRNDPSYLRSTTKRRDGKVVRGWEGIGLGPSGLTAVTGGQPQDF